MKIMTDEYRDRLRHWTETLQKDLYLPLGPINFEAARTYDQLSLEAAGQLNYEPVSQGFTWGNEWEYCWMRAKITLPPEAEGKRIALDLKPGGESTVFVNGRSFGTYRAAWVSYPHHFIEDNFLTDSGHAGDSYDLALEVYAGHDYPEAWGCATGPVLPGTFEPRVENDDRAKLGEATYGIWNEDAYQLFMDVDTLTKLLNVLDDTSLRAVRVAEALEKFTLIVDFEQDLPERLASYREARKVLAPVLADTNGSTAPDFYAIGHAHLDLAWLWPMAETYRKTSRTFAAQLRLLEEYPSYRYLQSQPAAYEMAREYYPELFERIKEAIKDGGWIAEGAMWVEPDTNMPSGEAMVRQLLYGLQYFKEELGVDSQVLWLPDTFGYSAALPQILAKSGVKYLVTQKIFWSYNGGERFPYHYFNWSGIDGTKVTAFLPTSYNYQTDPESLGKTWRERSQERDLDSFLIPFGYGDGGGGPSRDYIEYIEREHDLEGAPRVQMTDPVSFFETLEEKGGPKNTWEGELYFDAHRGTFTSQAMVKKNNRKAEVALREMEYFGALAGIHGQAYDLNEGAKLWKELLLHQFHDILPGSSIARVYVEAEKRVGDLIAEAERRTNESAAAITDGDNKALTVFNSLSFDREAVVELPGEYADGAVTADGTRIPVEKTDDGVRAFVHLPSMGAVTVYPENNKAEEDLAHVVKDGSVYVMENARILAKVDEKGEIISLVRKDSGREFAAGPMNHLRLFKDVPRLFDAWDIDSNYVDQEIIEDRNVTVTIAQDAGLQAVLEVKGTFGKSTYTQYIVLEADSERVEVRSEVDWKELHRLLKVSFPIDVVATNGINEIQFGYVERPTHRSRQFDKDRFEVCQHRYSALADSNHGAALLNDCKYGLSMNGNALELTLLRATGSPELRADNRVHNFTYAIYPFEGSFGESDTVRQALILNTPITTAPGAADGESLVSIDQKGVILDTIKPAEDGSGDLILRFYESLKAPGKATVTTAFAGKAWNTDLLENKESELENRDGTFTLDFKAFEIKTVRIALK